MVHRHTQSSYWLVMIFEDIRTNHQYNSSITFFFSFQQVVLFSPIHMLWMHFAGGLDSENLRWAGSGNIYTHLSWFLSHEINLNRNIFFVPSNLVVELIKTCLNSAKQEHCGMIFNFGRDELFCRTVNHIQPNIFPGTRNWEIATIPFIYNIVWDRSILLVRLAFDHLCQFCNLCLETSNSCSHFKFLFTSANLWFIILKMCKYYLLFCWSCGVYPWWMAV